MSLKPVIRPEGSAPTAASWSITERLTLWYAASGFLLVLLATAWLYWGLATNVDGEDDQILVDTVRVLRALIQERPGDTAALRQEVESNGAVRRYARIYVRVLDPQRRVTIETPGADEIFKGHQPNPVPSDSEPGPGVDVTSLSGTPFRILAARAQFGSNREDERIIEIAFDRTAEHRLLDQYKLRLFGVLVLALIAAGAVGRIIARRGMRPVEAIAETARSIGPSTLDGRIPTAELPAELCGLANTINQMLDRLEDAFARLSSLSADLAHELRTPINNLRGGVEVALGKPRTAVDYHEVMESVLEESVRLSQMIDSLLFLARAEDPKEQIFRKPLDVSRELAAVREFYEPCAADAGVRLEVADGTEGIIAALDRALFQRALSNLISNALTHTPAGGWVRLVAIQNNGALQIDVTDNGEGIPAEHLSRIFDRFYRVDPSRSIASGGMGLGLAIVRSIMISHGGSVQVFSECGRGTTVTLNFPGALLSREIVSVAAG
jgi:two-component system heavy metal sensor histidine kinase CusS